MNAELLAFHSERRAEFMGHINIPGAAQAGAVGKAGRLLHGAPCHLDMAGPLTDHIEKGREVDTSSLVIVDLMDGIAHAIGAISHDDIGNAETFDRLRLPHAMPGQKGDLLLVRHFRDQRRKVATHKLV